MRGPSTDVLYVAWESGVAILWLEVVWLHPTAPSQHTSPSESPMHDAVWLEQLELLSVLP